MRGFLFCSSCFILCFGNEWWKETAIYQVYPFSLYDTNSDGYGDLQGIQQKLDYLEFLGVETIWITPIYESPMKDFGYDVSNYLDINPLFGTLEDFSNLVRDVHNHGLKLIMDFVPNHSSDQHEWFLRSEERIWPYTDYYVWEDPKGWDTETGMDFNNMS